MPFTFDWTPVTNWVLARLRQPPAFGRRRAALVVTGLIIAFGVVDYATGIEVSLVVFYLVPVALAAAWLGRRVATAAALASVALRLIGDYMAIGAQPLPTWAWWNSLVGLFVFLIVIWVFGAFVALHRELELRVEKRTADLLEAANTRRRLERELQMVGAQERSAVGQELHDDICQHLVATAMAAKVLSQRLAENGNRLAPEAQAIVGWLEDGVRKTRQLARGLLVAAIAPDQLGERLAELADEASRSGVRCRFRQEGNAQVGDAGAAAQLFRIAQEALRNALKHADPGCVDVVLLGTPDSIRLIVEDDGSGFLPPSDSASGIGLRVMAQRAAYLGGTLTVEPAPGGGTKVVCELPRVLATA